MGLHAPDLDCYGVGKRGGQFSREMSEACSEPNNESANIVAGAAINYDAARRPSTFTTAGALPPKTLMRSPPSR